jgi:prevent-host-death family protein
MTAQRISIADVKRGFADVVGTVRHRHQRFIIERRGTPVAALVPLEDLARLEEPAADGGFLALVGAFADAPEFADALDGIVADRVGQAQRPAPRLGG